MGLGPPSEFVLILPVVFPFPVTTPFSTALAALLTPFLILTLLIAVDMRTVIRSLLFEFIDVFKPFFALPRLVLAAHTDLTKFIHHTLAAKLSEKASFSSSWPLILNRERKVRWRVGRAPL